ncbi:tetratricopeptide repeat protein [Embleya sp. NPDC127516]|uniref:tetratricopeptide repeat protein n=1 Tax=Embleya sp. NPDC127516 TaxID=3363990 RepID=UPI00381D054F
MIDNERDTALAEAIALREAGSVEEARARLVPLVERYPGDAQVAYQAAWAHDVLGLEREAVPFYEWALIGDGLPAEDRLGAFLGLGSTYRAFGAHDKAVAILQRGLTEFPDDPGLTTFLAMALYNAGDPKTAVESLLHVIATTSTHPHLTPYRKALTLYATDLDATHP